VTVDGAVPLNWSNIVGRSEGYVVQDLVDLVDKAIFESYRRTGKKNKLLCSFFIGSYNL
jgi:hypothetical protein